MAQMGDDAQQEAHPTDERAHDPGALDNYILPEISSLRLSKVHNGSCKPIVDKMKAERLAPKFNERVHERSSRRS